MHIHSKEQIEIALQVFGTSRDEIPDKFFLAQAKLLEVKNLHPIMKGWNTTEFSHFVWKAIVERKWKNDKFENVPTISYTTTIFLTAYNDNNLKISKKYKMLGWSDRPSKLLNPHLVNVPSMNKLNWERKQLPYFRLHLDQVPQILLLTVKIHPPHNN